MVGCGDYNNICGGVFIKDLQPPPLNIKQTQNRVMYLREAGGDLGINNQFGGGDCSLMLRREKEYLRFCLISH